MGTPSDTEHEKRTATKLSTLHSQFPSQYKVNSVHTHSPDSLCVEGCVRGTADDTDTIKCNRNS